MTHDDRTLPTPEEMLQHSRWVRRLARALVLDAASADDLVQDVWVAALGHRPRAGNALRPWLARVVRNLAVSRHRAETRRAERESLLETREPPPGSDEIAVSLETQQMLLDAVRQLRDPLRSTLVRHYFRGQTSVEIADEDGIAAGTVRWRLKQAVDTLREKLDDRHRGDRTAWMAFLAPIAVGSRGTPILTASTSAAGGIAGTHISMNMLAKIGVASALVMAAAAVWTISRPEPPIPLERGVAVSGAETDVERGAVEVPATLDDRAPISSTRTTPAAPVVATVRSPSAVVEARLVDSQGAPVAAATLMCTDRVGRKGITREQAPQAASDEHGGVRLTLSRSDEGRNRGRDASMPADEWYATLEVEAVAHARVDFQVRLKLGTTTTLGDIVLPEAGDLIGRVLDSDGQPVDEADVQLSLPGLTLEGRDAAECPSTPHPVDTRSRPDGSFLMRGVPCGFYRVWARRSGMRASVSEVFEVRAGEELRAPNLVIAANPHLVRGHVVNADGSPCARATVRYAVSGHEDGWLGQPCERDGSFAIELMSRQTVDIYAAVSDDSAGDGVLRNVPAGSSDLLLRIGKPLWIDLSVRDPQGASVPGCILGVYDLSGNGGGSDHGSPGGRYRFKAIAIPFRLDVSAPGFERQVLGPFDANAIPSEIAVILRPVARVTGRVTAGGRSQGRAFVYLVRVADSDAPRRCNGFPTRFEWTPREYVRTLDDGAFAFDCRQAGRFVVVVQAKGFALFESKDLDLSPEHGAPDLEISLTRGGALEGRVLTAPGDGIDGQWVTASRGLGIDVSAAVDAQGRYRIEGLAAGTWWMRRTSADLRSRAQESLSAPNDPTLTRFEITDGSTTTLDLDARNAPPVLLLGHFSVAGTDMRSWTACFVQPGDDPWQSRAEPVDRDGSFRIAISDVGRVPLTLLGAGSQDRDTRLEIALDLASGENRWSLDVATAELAVDGPSLARGLLAHVRRFENGATFTTRFRSTDGKSLALAGVPTGPAQIVDAMSGAVLAEVDVPTGGRAQVTLP